MRGQSLRQEQYHGWLIELVPEPKGFSFRCWQAADQCVRDCTAYPSPEYSIWVARRRIDLETAAINLSRLVTEIGGWARPSDTEQIALIQSIQEFVRAESDRLSHLAQLE